MVNYHMNDHDSTKSELVNILVTVIRILESLRSTYLESLKKQGHALRRHIEIAQN